MERKVCVINCAETGKFMWKKMNHDPYLTACKINNSKSNINLNIKARNIKSNMNTYEGIFANLRHANIF